jgi:hypothetical protein
VLAAAVAGVVISACGGSSGAAKVSATAYATSLCKAFGPFERDIYNRQSALSAVRSPSPAQGKATLVTFLSALAGDTETAGAKMRSAGTPDVAQGKLISRGLVAMFQRLDKTLRAAESRARALPIANATAFRTAATSLAADVRTSVGDAGAGLAGLKTTALEKAASHVAACRSLS